MRLRKAGKEKEDDIGDFIWWSGGGGGGGEIEENGKLEDLKVDTYIYFLVVENKRNVEDDWRKRR